MPLPSGAVRSRSAVSNSGSPKKSSAPASENAISSRSSTPAVDLRQPAEALQLAAPSSEIRYWITARRSLRSSSGRPFLSAKWKTRLSDEDCTSVRSSTLDSRIGPKEVTVARTGMPVPWPPRA